MEANRNGENKKRKSYTQILKDTLQLYNAELKMEEYYNEIISHFILNANPKSTDFTGEELIPEVKHLFQSWDSYNIRFTGS